MFVSACVTVYVCINQLVMPENTVFNESIVFLVLSFLLEASFWKLFWGAAKFYSMSSS